MATEKNGRQNGKSTNGQKVKNNRDAEKTSANKPLNERAREDEKETPEKQPHGGRRNEK